ncbi:hypothetical protein ACJ41O_001350 [Fusarium nematophilum]
MSSPPKRSGGDQNAGQPPFGNYFGVEGHLAVSFHRSHSAPDRGRPMLQRVFVRGEALVSAPLEWAKLRDGEDNTYVLCMKSMDTMAICIRATPDTRLAFKVKVSLGRLNVAAPGPDFGQDYFVVAGRPEGERYEWVDGVAAQLRPQRAVRQFVVLAPGTGHSFQDQLQMIKSGDEFNIEITRNVDTAHFASDKQPAPDVSTGSSLMRRITSLSIMSIDDPEKPFQICIKTLLGRNFTFDVYSTTTIHAIMKMIWESQGICVHLQRLLYARKELISRPGEKHNHVTLTWATANDCATGRTLRHYGIKAHATLHLTLRLAGGGGEGPPKVGAYEGVEPRRHEALGSDLDVGPSILEVAPGGLIRQNIRLDSSKYEWATMPMTTLRIRMVDSATFKELTGLQPPSRPPTPTGGMEPVGWNMMMDEVAVTSVAEHERSRASAVPFTRAELEAGSPNSPLEQRRPGTAQNPASKQAPRQDHQVAGDGKRSRFGVKKFFRQTFNKMLK